MLLEDDNTFTCKANIVLHWIEKEDACFKKVHLFCAWRVTHIQFSTVEFYIKKGKAIEDLPFFKTADEYEKMTNVGLWFLASN